MDNLYHCTDQVGMDYLSPGKWVHEGFVTVPKINRNVTMSDQDQIREGWTMGRLWLLWSGILAVSIVVSLATVVPRMPKLQDLPLSQKK